MNQQLTEEQAARIKSVIAVVSARANAELRALVEACAKDVQVSLPEVDFGNAVAYVSQFIIATLLAQLRAEGCLETDRQRIMVEAIALAETLQVK